MHTGLLLQDCAIFGDAWVMWPWAWESPEEDGHWAGKRTKPREQRQVSSDMDPDLVGADLQDVGGKESEGTQGAQVSSGDPGRWQDCGSEAGCVSVQVGVPVLISAQGRGLLKAQPLESRIECRSAL